ncbi:hypothetical protein NADFUDRAFT_46691 [Nadsonia fulvescens var. elongata DSM 6958]|uniref:Uncharacterized protein n=1 Tax=Nadsonia fulvescens var. elongata DSM 6958 TaxID=857566 RepID=A0A1E3PL52_9ASCO|nr:hypothetical protein NADFUDRAFT_46691 [Nadsonia fulvescens var. elongata DSM 6958]
MSVTPAKPSFAAMAASGLKSSSSRSTTPTKSTTPLTKSSTPLTKSSTPLTKPSTPTIASIPDTDIKPAATAFRSVKSFNGHEVSEHLTSVFKAAAADPKSRVLNGNTPGWSNQSGGGYIGRGMGDRVLVELKKGKDRL